MSDKKVEEKKGEEKKDGKEEKKKGAGKKVGVKKERARTGPTRKERKANYIKKLTHHLQTYSSALLVKVDNVGSNQIQGVRKALRGKAALLMGKNTIIRKVLRERMVENPKLECLLPLIKENVGFVFCNADLSNVRDECTKNKVPAAAKTGVKAPADVFVPAGPTPLDPSQTSFFQALNIPTKITRGAIEIINQVHLIKSGDKVTASAVALLNKLNIKPFFYGIEVLNVYDDGILYSPTVLDMDKKEMISKFVAGMQKLNHIALATHHAIPTAVPQLLIRGASKLVYLAMGCDFTFKWVEGYKQQIAEAKASEEAAAAGGAAAGEEKKEAAPGSPKKAPAAAAKKSGSDKSGKSGKSGSDKSGKSGSDKSGSDSD